MHKVLKILRGVPGQGKSTLANLIVSAHNAAEDVVVRGPYEADAFMIDKDGKYCFDPSRLHFCHESCLEQVRAAMQENADVIVTSNTNILRKNLVPYLALAEKYGYAVQEIIVKSPFKSIHGVPPEKVQEMRAKFQF